MSGLHPELIWAFEVDETQIGPIHLAFDIEVENKLQGEETLHFTMLPDDPKLSWVTVDSYVQYKGEAWRVSKRTSSRTKSEYAVKYEAKALWYDLIDDIKFGLYLLTGLTLGDGGNQILSTSNWTVGFADDDLTLHSYEAENKSVLELLRAWAMITQTELTFNTLTREVNFVLQQGTTKEVGFRYGRNLDEVVQTYEPPIATRLYPIGAQDITINNVNGGLSYIDNFDWYISQGLTLAEAQELYMKEAIWEDDSYIVGLALFDAAVAKLEVLSHPTISYECTVMDLSALTNLPTDAFSVGDIVPVQDDSLGVEINTRIVRMINRPYEPWDNVVELSYLRPGLTSNLLSSISSGGGGGGSNWRLLVDESTSLSIGATPAIVCQINFTTTDNANGIVGGHFVGEADGVGTLTFYCYLDGIPISGNPEVEFQVGDIIDMAIPTWFSGLAEGSHTLELRAAITAGYGLIAVQEFQGRMYVMLTGLLGGGAGGGNAIINVADTVPDETEMPPDSETVALLTDTTSGPSDAVDDEYVAVTDSAPTILIE